MPFQYTLLLHISKCCLEKELITIPAISLLRWIGLILCPLIHLSLAASTSFLFPPWPYSFQPPSLFFVSYKFDFTLHAFWYILYLWTCAINSNVSNWDNFSNCMLPGCHGTRFAIRFAQFIFGVSTHLAKYYGPLINTVQSFYDLTDMGWEKAKTLDCPQILTADNYSIFCFILFV